MKLVFFDTETTGLDARNDQVIELAAKVYDENMCLLDKMDDFVQLQDPSKGLPDKIKELTGITEEMLKEQGKPASEVARRFSELCVGEEVILIAHNAQFDLNFVSWMLYRHYNAGLPTITEAHYLDTLTIARDRKSGRHRLQDMIEYYHLTGVENSHRAIDDVTALVHVFCAMGREWNNFNLYMDSFGYDPKYGVSGQRLAKVRYFEQTPLEFFKAGA